MTNFVRTTFGPADAFRELPAPITLGSRKFFLVGGARDTDSSPRLALTRAVRFDAYYHQAYEVAREEVMASMGLDPTRPLITVATGGTYDRGFYGRDETHLVEDVLRMIHESEVLRGAQPVIRLRPVSHLEFFWKYWNRPEIKISFASTMPTIEWCPNRQDLIEQINLLRHSDVINTPRSSWVLEAAIFDRPTVVPVYSDRQPEHAAARERQPSVGHR
jgi:hypothetical protein